MRVKDRRKTPPSSPDASASKCNYPPHGERSVMQTLAGRRRRTSALRVLTGPGLTSPEPLPERFEWNLTRDDLADLIQRLTNREPQLRLAA